MILLLIPLFVASEYLISDHRIVLRLRFLWFNQRPEYLSLRSEEQKYFTGGQLPRPNRRLWLGQKQELQNPKKQTRGHCSLDGS